MASGITLQSTNNSVVKIKNIGTNTDTTEVIVPNRDMIMGSEITLDTAQATTSGTYKDFAIPAGVKRVTVMFDGVSTNGTSIPIIQLGDSGGIENTGYISAGSVVPNGATIIGANSTTGLLISGSWASTIIASGASQITLVTRNTYSHTGLFGRSDTPNTTFGAGSKTLSSELTTVRITTVNGTDTFDAGTVNVSWEF